ncbi:hypothetical protein FACS1894217_11250 [Clostridia bacterium]|nr:hypothetical protein FACS1894217_11250 [Clostridia bacterium]
MKQISAEEFDKIFDEGEEDILQYCDLTKIVRADEKDKKAVMLAVSMMNALENKNSFSAKNA